MTKNPIINALGSFLYISLIAAFFYLANHFLSSKPDNSFLAPIAMLSLFTLSAAVMGYLFLYQPLQLYFDGKKKAAIDLFLRTVASFAVITLIVLGLLFSGVFS
jgi:hypothetical protein